MSGRRFFFAALLLLVGMAGVGCNSQSESNSLNQLTIGVVSYGEGTGSLEQYEPLKEYLERQTKSIVQLEPAYNEIQALEQVSRKKWDIVFAPPGLAAIAIEKDLYIPLFPLEEIDSTRRSLLIVREDSPAQTLTDLNGKVVALGEPGSAAGYYLPLYDLYGLVLSEIRFAPTPREILQWVSDGTVEAGALSMGDFERYHQDFTNSQFRVLHTSRWIPPGLVLLGPTVERNLQEQIEKAMEDASSDVTSDAGYIPTAPLPDYSQFTQLIDKVLPLREKVQQKPAVLLIEAGETGSDPTLDVASPSP